MRQKNSGERARNGHFKKNRLTQGDSFSEGRSKLYIFKWNTHI